MHRRRKTLVFIVIVVLVMQVIQPIRNKSDPKDAGDNDIQSVYAVPEEVNRIFVDKCFDCHSNNTRYPWYFNVQPIGWWLAAHIHDGKEHLNFSEFRSYDAEKANKQLDEIVEVVEERSMPLKLYVLLNPHAEITDEDETAIRAWVESVRERVD